METKTVFLTGAGGCVGRRVMSRLLEEGWAVTALLMEHEVEGFAFANNPNVQIEIGDLTSLQAQAIPVGSVIIHLAAHVHTIPTNESQRKKFFEINTDATAKLAKHALQRNASGFVFISSLAVYGAGTSEAFSESSPLNPNTTYGESKRDAEIELSKLLPNRIPRVILRPAVIYGPGDRGNFLRLIRSVAKGSFPVINGGHARKTTLYVDNLARTIVFFAENAAGFDGQVFNVADPEARTMREIAQAVANTAGVRLKIRNIPSWLLTPFALAGDLLGSIIGREMPLSSRKIRVMTTDTMVDTTVLHKTIGDKVQFASLDEGLAEYLSSDESPI